MIGRQMVGLKAGRAEQLFGLGCNDHGLLYAQEAVPFSVRRPEAVELFNGAQRPSPRDPETCPFCGSPLIGCGFGLEEFAELSDRLRAEFEAVCAIRG